MDQSESDVINLDEDRGDTPVISHNSSQQNLFLAMSATRADSDSPSFPLSGTGSGFSSPPDPAPRGISGGQSQSLVNFFPPQEVVAPAGTVDPQPQQGRQPQSVGDSLIHDVIEQLETQCSFRIEATAVDDPSSAVPQFLSASGLFAAERPTAAEDVFRDQVQHAADARMRIAWIAGAKTRETLSKLPHHDKRLCYSMPGVMIEESVGDPVRDLLKKHVGESEAVKRAAKTVNIPEHLDTLRTLITDGNYRSAVDLTSKLLKNLGQGFGCAHKHSRNSEESLNLWSTRLNLLLTIGQHNLAASELEPFGNLDSPDLYYDYYPEIFIGKRGSLVPFDMRLLHSELPRLIGHSSESLPRVNRIVDTIRTMLSNLDLGLNEDGSNSTISPDERAASKRFWNIRLMKTYKVLARCLFAVKEYRSVLEICEKIVTLNVEEDGWERCKIFSDAARVCLQLGDFTNASVWLQKFNNSVASLPSSVTSTDRAKANVCSTINIGICHVFNNNYTDALQAFQKALDLDPSDVSAANNAAVCMLYLGRLQDAVVMLEHLIRNYPKQALQENICTNLCTLYELASARSVQKKIALLNLVNEYLGDGFNPSCLKLSG